MEKVATGVFWVGGGELSDPADCCVYALDLGETVLIDCGCGPGWPQIRANLQAAGLDPGRIHTLVLTHAHVDHIGAASSVVAESGCRLIAHALDAEAIELGDPQKTASEWYGVRLSALALDEKIKGDGRALDFPWARLQLVHTPGHTPGSLAAWLDTQEGRVLFGQDIHGPFSDHFGSDLEAWRDSMDVLLDLEADLLCEGHFGIIRGKDKVRTFIETHLQRNAPG